MVLSEVNCSERKNPPTSSTATISHHGVAAVNSAIASRKPAPTIAFTVSTVRKPKRRRIGWAVNFITSAPPAATNVRVPDANGSSPKPTCSIIGSKNGTAPAATRNGAPPMTLVRKVAMRRRSRLRMGAGVRRWWRQY
jgi:hypothetical protein